jgi:hypothetical protein
MILLFAAVEPSIFSNYNFERLIGPSYRRLWEKIGIVEPKNIKYVGGNV